MNGARRPLASATALAVVAMLGGCSAAPGSASPGSGASLRVLAAASLTDTFPTLVDDFRTAHPGVEVTVSYGGSSDLVAQLQAGAPADVLASASTKTMDSLVDSGDASDPVVFATNRLAVAVPAGNRAKVTTLADLTRPGVKVALCRAAVPCGDAAGKLLAKTHLAVKPVTLEPDVRAVLTKVELGEVDAGLVYVTDVKAAGESVAEVEVPEELNVVSTYSTAVITSSDHPDLAADFVKLVSGPTGRQVMTGAGFGAP
ncbi:MAG TPA: molybdate ABC transporter substrate-binding protein [Candidatus Luteococcus avicola]|nr:molybdate ABC transporter substrate-binding protein [Candidatus Luteococcus avicola]